MTIKENPIIQVKHLSKKYRIGMDRSYKTFSESVINLLKSPLKTIKNIRKHNDIFWALKDINFEVNRGEILGIIGRNGAGKSTLLKILSRITHLTEGEVILRGRVGSLLEVGTGFHPELTGRENIYFNGAILGMKKQEIENKFDEIIEFSGVEKFLDTPLKRYSSGMQVRLAFSVAAHMDPEILLVDEVLAVGDTAFQKKCLGKMKDVATGGRTVLFVSHNMRAVRKLCPKGILLSNGQLIESGCMDLVIKKYLDHSIGSDGKNSLRDVSFSGTLVNDVHFEELQMYNPNSNKICTSFEPNQKIGLAVKYKVTKKLNNFKVTFSLYCNDLRLLSLHDVEKGVDIDPGWYISKIELSENILRPNTYWVAVGASEDGKMFSWIYAEDIVSFDIEEIWLDENLKDNIGLVNVKGQGQRRRLT